MSVHLDCPWCAGDVRVEEFEIARAVRCLGCGVVFDLAPDEVGRVAAQAQAA
ncbi:MAG: hypothetical protein H0X16_09655 [Chloroflexi bacterium]|nr:hypothetical protein [Chloroflexota bacterium]